MTKRFVLLLVSLLLVYPQLSFAKERNLKGVVLLIQPNGNKLYAAQVEVSIVGIGNPNTTMSDGSFKIALPDYLTPGKRLRISVLRKGWSVWTPVLSQR